MHLFGALLSWTLTHTLLQSFSLSTKIQHHPPCFPVDSRLSVNTHKHVYTSSGQDFQIITGLLVIIISITTSEWWFFTEFSLGFTPFILHFAYSLQHIVSQLLIYHLAVYNPPPFLSAFDVFHSETLLHSPCSIGQLCISLTLLWKSVGLPLAHYKS